MHGNEEEKIAKLTPDRRSGDRRRNASGNVNLSRSNDEYRNGETALVFFNKAIFGIFIITTWLMGIVLSKGIWELIISILFPPYAWYLLAEYTMRFTGFIQ